MFTEQQKEVLNELQSILTTFSDIEGLNLTLELKNNKASYQVFYENESIIAGSGDNLIDAALKAEQAVIEYFDNKEE